MKVLNYIYKIFQHDCRNHKSIIERNYHIRNDIGYVGLKKCECKKCGKIWME